MFAKKLTLWAAAAGVLAAGAGVYAYQDGADRPASVGAPGTTGEGGAGPVDWHRAGRPRAGVAPAADEPSGPAARPRAPAAERPARGAREKQYGDTGHLSPQPPMDPFSAGTGHFSPQHLMDPFSAGIGHLSPQPPDLSGAWRGDGWGEITLGRTKEGTYEGTYTDTLGEGRGTLQLRWDPRAQRFEGVWGQGSARHGRISLRVLEVGRTIRGAYTTGDSSERMPGVPALADLEWRPADEPPPPPDGRTPHAEGRASGEVAPGAPTGEAADLERRVKRLEDQMNQLLRERGRPLGR